MYLGTTYFGTMYFGTTYFGTMYFGTMYLGTMGCAFTTCSVRTVRSAKTCASASVRGPPTAVLAQRIGQHTHRNVASTLRLQQAAQCRATLRMQPRPNIPCNINCRLQPAQHDRCGSVQQRPNRSGLAFRDRNERLGFADLSCVCAASRGCETSARARTPSARSCCCRSVAAPHRLVSMLHRVWPSQPQADVVARYLPPVALCRVRRAWQIPFVRLRAFMPQRAASAAPCGMNTIEQQ